jgi:hypothetical protein
MGLLWPGASRREENHAKWETADPKQAVKMKAKEAQRQALEKDRKAKEQARIRAQLAAHTKPNRDGRDGRGGNRRRRGWSW